MSKKACICQEMKDSNPWSSVTFTCPKHGKVTIDTRLALSSQPNWYYPYWWYQPTYVQPYTPAYTVTCGDAAAATLLSSHL